MSLRGWENLEEAEQRGRGIFILSAHLGLWELVPPLIGLTRGRMDIVVRPASSEAPPLAARLTDAHVGQSGDENYPHPAQALLVL